MLRISLILSPFRKLHFLVDLLRLPAAVGKVDNSGINASNDSDISELLPLIFAFAMIKSPKQILELGTRGGESTRALVKVATELKIQGYSVDLSPCPKWLSTEEKWTHFVADDLSFAHTLADTRKWPNGENFQGLDFIFLDTSHEYEHTKAELNAYWPLLNSNGIMLFHDTNLTSKLTRRLSGKPNYGWNNNRGVCRAIEDYFESQIPENRFKVLHPFPKSTFAINVPWNNGLLLIQKSE